MHRDWRYLTGGSALLLSFSAALMIARERRRRLDPRRQMWPNVYEKPYHYTHPVTGARP